METSGGIGTVGKYDVKLSGGVATAEVSVSVDLSALIIAKAAQVTNSAEKAILIAAADVLKAIP